MRDRWPNLLLLATLAVLVAVVGYVLFLRPDPVADSRDPSLTQADRVAWATNRLAIDPPTPILDAHFRTRVIEHEGGHMGPGWSMGMFHVRLDLTLGSGDAWAALSKPLDRPADASVFESRPASPWGCAAGEEVGLRWFEAKPIFGETGVAAVTAKGDALFAYIVRR